MRNRLTYANVMATLAVFIALGGAAYAANTVGSSDVIDNSLLSADLKNNQAVKSADVQAEALTGADIKNQSGVDTCVLTVRIGQLCVRAENSYRTWLEAVRHCANLDLRAPTLAEALELAQTHDIPNVDENENFWTGERYYHSAGVERANYSTDFGVIGNGPTDLEMETVCVMNPTN